MCAGWTPLDTASLSVKGEGPAEAAELAERPDMPETRRQRYLCTSP
jgi:hypothetical protein